MAHPYELAELVALVKTKSPFYRKLYASIPAKFLLSDLPIIPQEKYWQANSIHNNQLLTGPMNEGIIFKSGGTTGNPKFSFFTQQEWNDFTAAFGEGMVKGGLKKNERVANLFYVGELYASFIFIMKSLEAASERTLHLPLAGSASSENILHALSDFSVDVLAGIPTTLIALLETLDKKQLSQLSLKKILFGGESMYPDQRDFIKKILPQCHVQSIGYAAVDSGLLGFVDSFCQSDEHRVFEQNTIFEIVDEDTGEPITQPNHAGKVLITNLDRALMPIIRYPVGDRAQWIEPEKTPFRKYQLLGRSEEGARIGPATLYYEDILKFLEAFQTPCALSGFQMLIRHKQKCDQLILRLATRNSAQARTHEEQLLKALLHARPMLQDLLDTGKILHPQIEWIAYADLLKNSRTGKLKRIIDERK